LAGDGRGLLVQAHDRADVLKQITSAPDGGKEAASHRDESERPHNNLSGIPYNRYQDFPDSDPSAAIAPVSFY